MSHCIDTELALSALKMAASTRALAPRWIHHTDRDCRYGSDDYLAALKQLGARPSMSRKGDCWDNAVSESFFATLEKELLALQALQSRRITRDNHAALTLAVYASQLSFPRSRGRTATQDSLPAGGQPLPGGGHDPARSLMKFLPHLHGFLLIQVSQRKQRPS
jgi:transposase InsO family protein